MQIFWKKSAPCCCLVRTNFKKSLEKNKKIWYNTVWLQKMRQIAKRHVKFNRKTRIPDIKSFLFELQKIGGEERS